MRRLLHPNQVPPGGWRFLERTTNVLIKAPTYENLKALIVEHRQANNLAAGLNLEQEIEEQICANLDHNDCTDSARPLHAQGGQLTLGQVFTGTVTLAHWLLTGGKKVDLTEANRRAEICSTCQFNVSFDGCQGCHGETLRAAVDSIVQGQKTEYDEKLNACSLCGCSLKAKVFLPLNILRQHIPADIQAAFPNWCWLK